MADFLQRVLTLARDTSPYTVPVLASFMLGLAGKWWWLNSVCDSTLRKTIMNGSTHNDRIRAAFIEAVLGKHPYIDREGRAKSWVLVSVRFYVLVGTFLYIFWIVGLVIVGSKEGNALSLSALFWRASLAVAAGLVYLVSVVFVKRAKHSVRLYAAAVSADSYRALEEQLPFSAPRDKQCYLLISALKAEDGAPTRKVEITVLKKRKRSSKG